MTRAIYGRHGVVEILYYTGTVWNPRGSNLGSILTLYCNNNNTAKILYLYVIPYRERRILYYYIVVESK